MEKKLIVLLLELSNTYKCKAYKTKINKEKFVEHILQYCTEKHKNLSQEDIDNEGCNAYKCENVSVHDLIKYAIDNGYIDTAIEDSRYLIMLKKGERFLENSLKGIYKKTLLAPIIT
ncbi:hypothetical protein CPJCM30710_12460 [Clostridium polyendosporum]|uniref:Uncharacterized protein n=1 Tax=Clostridium polyendosporum TaxID=69208 RepID=A0A919RXZ2_9CLOT|nr:hypothetical protein [Clostridium polyendosporum]GIM28580.1 hypothetical protein CPJCM30710_12460 [Clostridium polyendosporum]